MMHEPQLDPTHTTVLGRQARYAPTELAALAADSPSARDNPRLFWD